jgi:hypothetical protein
MRTTMYGFVQGGAPLTRYNRESPLLFREVVGYAGESLYLWR